MAKDRIATFMAELEAKQIEYLRFELPDMHGVSRSKTVPVDKVEAYARSGLNFYGGVLGLDTSSNVVPADSAKLLETYQRNSTSPNAVSPRPSLN